LLENVEISVKASLPSAKNIATYKIIQVFNQNFLKKIFSFAEK
jgi:hypothetical protein